VNDPVSTWWAAVVERDWDRAAAQLHPDVVVDWPATGERLRGRDAFVEVQRIFPEGWSIEVRRVLREGDGVAVEARVPHGDEVFFCAGFYEVRDGLVVRAVEHWSGGSTLPAAPWRAHLVEPLDGR
jgi:ketosteroid isomerase-like protein